MDEAICHTASMVRRIPLAVGLIGLMVGLQACDRPFDTSVQVVSTGSQVCVEGVENHTSKCFASGDLPADLAAAPVGACLVVRMNQSGEILSVRRACSAARSTG